MNERLVHRGPDSEGALPRGRRRLGDAPSLDHRPRARRPADLQRGRQRSPSSRTARSTTTASCAASSSGAATASPPPPTPRFSSTSTRSTASGSSSACAGCSRSRSGTRASSACSWPATASGSSRSTTARRGGRSPLPPSSRLMLEQPGFSRQIDPQAVAAYLAFNSIPAPLTIFAEARKLPAGTLAVWREGKLTLTRYARPEPVPAGETRRRPAGELAAELRETLRDSDPRPPRRRRAGRRAALGRGRLGRARRPRCRRAGRAGEDLLGRLRGGELRRARPGAAGRRALPDRAPRDRPAARRGRALPQAGRGLRRALRRLLGAADLPRLRAGRGRGQGRPLGRGWRRALRRLLHLRRRPARAADRPPRRARRAPDRAPAQLRRQGQLRLQSQALRPRRGAAAAGAPPRLEGDLLAAAPGLAAWRPRLGLGPGRHLP